MPQLFDRYRIKTESQEWVTRSAEYPMGKVLAVAKRMVLFLKRSGGQRQFSSELLAQSQSQGVSAQLIAWLRPRLAQPVDITQMANASALSVVVVPQATRRNQLNSGATVGTLTFGNSMHTP